MRKLKNKLTIMHARIRSSRFLTTDFQPTNVRTSSLSLPVHLNSNTTGTIPVLKERIKVFLSSQQEQADTKPTVHGFVPRRQHAFDREICNRDLSGGARPSELMWGHRILKCSLPYFILDTNTHNLACNVHSSSMLIVSAPSNSLLLLC